MALSQNRKGDRLELDGGRFRVEAGPALLKGKATAALLDNSKTAEHYQVGLKDALGATIEADKPFTYLDWKGGRVFYLYEKEDVDPNDPDTPYFVPEGAITDREGNEDVVRYTYVYRERGTYESEEAAIDAAEKLAGA